jgi:hypothetical protein
MEIREEVRMGWGDAQPPQEMEFARALLASRPVRKMDIGLKVFMMAVGWIGHGWICWTIEKAQK